MEEGIEVKTNSPRVIRARKLVAGLLYLRCPEVPEVKRLAEELGALEEAWIRRFAPSDEKCILCGTCVNSCPVPDAIKMIVEKVNYKGKYQPIFWDATVERLKTSRMRNGERIN